MTYFFDTFETPVGPFSVGTDATGALVATAFGGIEDLKRRGPEGTFNHDLERTAHVRSAIGQYWSGATESFKLRLAATGTPFQHAVWARLQAIPPGETRTYGQIATEIDRPGAARAVGRANATNPICLVVPCHRVIGADGSLTGFAFGEAIKRQLLEHESKTRAAAA